MKKNLFFNIVVIVLAIATITVGTLLIFKNQGDALISVGNVKGLNGDIVELPVIIEKNPGVWGGQILIDYDSDELSFISISSGTVFETCESNNTGDSIAMVVYNASSNAELKNSKKDGVIATLKFKIKVSADKGVHDISINPETNFCNAQEELIDIKIKNGTITVK